MEQVEIEDSTPPPTKKPRADNDNKVVVKSIVAVLDNQLSSPETPLRSIFTAELISKKDASSLLKNLPPLPPELEHLKRIRTYNGTLEIIIGESSLPPGHPSLASFSRVSETSVPTHRPLSTQQFRKWNEFWPCNFHPDKEIEKLLSENCGFGEDELKLISANLQAVLDRFQATGKQSCAVYDPTDKELVCLANSSPKILGHSVMNCLNLLAETQKDPDPGRTAQDSKGDILCQRLPRTKPTDYLCTGLDIFTSHEPCIMCSMALLHSRARRLFFVHQNESNGGLMSVVKLHCLGGINHRFQVFKVDMQ